jgi:protein AFG1
VLDDINCIYLWGDPGCGKSFMIEEFYKHLDMDPKNKQFLHYQEFMLQIHQMEHKVNKKLKGKSQDTITAVGDIFSEDLLLLCIDEF